MIENARQKALEVVGRLQGQDQRPQLVIGCDTVVVLDGKILEKPKDEADAFRMLSSLSNSKHQVFSGVALVLPQMTHLFSEVTHVSFHELDATRISSKS